MTIQTIGTLYSFILVVKGTEEKLSKFDSMFCSTHETEINADTLTVQIKVNGKKLALTEEYETRSQVIGRMTPAIESAITEAGVSVISFK